jgi:CheY-like chemotaxis protein
MARILLIEDDETLRRMLAITLVQIGHDVLEARDGQEGLALQSSVNPDLVLTDIIMPERDGIEAILALRRRAPHIPVIAMSGGGRVDANDYLTTARHLGAVATLAKPFSTTDLTTAIDQALTSQRDRPQSS